MLYDFTSKLNYEKKVVKFVEKEYELKTDHKTGLLLDALYKEASQQNQDDKMLKLILGEKQYDELQAELDGIGVNYSENIEAVAIGVMAVLYGKTYEEFAEAVKAGKK